MNPLTANSATPQPAQSAQPELAWHDVAGWGVEGRGWSEGFDGVYDRLPARAKTKVDSGIWGYARNSAGLSTEFYTDAAEIHVRYRLNTPNLSAFPDVSNTSTSGVDLYVAVGDGATEARQAWRFVVGNKPRARDVNDVLAKGMAPGRRRYRLYFPLYNGVEKLEIGVPQTASFEPVPPRNKKPIVFYGTSITQGGVASRAGLAFPSILGRRLGVPIVNLGFCGYGRMEPELADLVAEIDASVYVIDALQNMPGDQVVPRTRAFVARLRKDHPQTPILLVEFGEHPVPDIFPAETAKRAKLNAALRSVYEELTRAGDLHLHYLAGGALLGSDGEATGEGLHPNAIGMLRYADAYEPVLRKILKRGH
ncbi:MAG TPA: SGNH/GDSL hydrolase family protein [Opitutaceae bacterium]|nr:SGNH/GDSL hydrolase family protein [Opitutaceae bacterium]